jgi:PIN domain nuclease of toxin-antitoxin system
VSGFLLDTSVVLWIVSAGEKVPSRVRRALSSPDAALHVSVASAWEIVLKHRAGKLVFRTRLEEILDQILHRSPWTMLPISSQHLPVLAALPFIHKDPFDRVLIAQAQVEALTLVTPDTQIRKYKVSTLW